MTTILENSSRGFRVCAIEKMIFRNKKRNLITFPIKNCFLLSIRKTCYRSLTENIRDTKYSLYTYGYGKEIYRQRSFSFQEIGIGTNEFVKTGITCIVISYTFHIPQEIVPISMNKCTMLVTWKNQSAIATIRRNIPSYRGSDSFIEIKRTNLAR